MATTEFERDANLVRRVNVGDLLVRSAWRAPVQLAVVDGERRVTYRELNAGANRMANALTGLGYARGDTLALVSGNSLEFLVTYFACAKLGVVCVPLNLAWGAQEMAYVLGHAKCRGAVVESQLVTALAPALHESPAVADLIVASGTGADWPDPTDRRCTTVEQLCADASDVEPEHLVDDRDPITYLYTSGTTSAPKGVVSSHLSVVVESLSAAIDLGFTRHERSAAMMPLFHTAQLNAVCTPVLAVGGTLFLLRGFEAATLLALVEAEGITQIFGIPSMYRAMLDNPDLAKRDLASLRLALYAMAPMPEGDLRRAIEAFGCDFALAFGQTEMAPITTVFRPEHQLSHAGSVGTPLVITQVGIMDSEGALLPDGSVGEIVYRGPNTMEGYLHDAEASEAAFAHGWFHSGDLGSFDDDGVLWYADRAKDVIKTGGENVASIEVERALYAAEPRIAEVVVIGLPHPRWLEAVTAVVTARTGETLTEEEVLAAVRPHLAGFKQPKAVIIADELPRTSTGKVRKVELRETHDGFYGA